MKSENIFRDSAKKMCSTPNSPAILSWENTPGYCRQASRRFFGPITPLISLIQAPLRNFWPTQPLHCQPSERARTITVLIFLPESCCEVSARRGARSIHDHQLTPWLT